MKGLVFTEFLEMVEKHHGLDMVDTLIEQAALDSNGAYTSVGTYDHNELIRLIRAYSRELSIPEDDITRDFGIQLFARFARISPRFLQGLSSASAFLLSMETSIHREVVKLYPGAELPMVSCREHGKDALELYYSSSRPFSYLAEGLILGCIAHFGQPVELRREDLPMKDGMNSVRFTLTCREVAS